MLNSQFMRLQRTAHTKALRAPMTYLPMEGDAVFTMLSPSIQAGLFPNEDVDFSPGRAQLERRACQYASFMLRKQGFDPGDYAATFDGVDAITFTCAEEIPIVIVIPKHLMDYDPDAALISSEGEDSAPLETLNLF